MNPSREYLVEAISSVILILLVIFFVNNLMGKYVTDVPSPLKRIAFYSGGVAIAVTLTCLFVLAVHFIQMET